MNVEKLAEIIKSGRSLKPEDFGFTEIRESIVYAKYPFELKNVGYRGGWTLLKWETINGKLQFKSLVRDISLDTPGLMKLQKHLRNDKLEELLGIIT